MDTLVLIQKNTSQTSKLIWNIPAVDVVVLGQDSENFPAV